MARVRIFGDFESPLRSRFTDGQINFDNFLNDFSDNQVARITGRAYTLRSAPTEPVNSFTKITGKLKTSLPFDQRSIKSFEITKGDSDGSLTLKIDRITGLNFAEFTDPDFDSFRKVLRGNDTIFGTDGPAVLNGFRGNDDIYVKSFNAVFGGSGSDEFIFDIDTRSARILDYNPNKDSLSILNDSPDNYIFVPTFGVTQIQNLQGDVIATLEDINDPLVVQTLELV